MSLDPTRPTKAGKGRCRLLLDAESRLHRLLGVVGADDRRAEDRHNGVTHQLVNERVVLKKDFRAAAKNLVHGRGHLLRRSRFREMSEATRIREEYGYFQ